MNYSEHFGDQHCSAVLGSGNGYTLVVFRGKRDIYSGEFSYSEVGAVVLRFDY